MDSLRKPTSPHTLAAKQRVTYLPIEPLMSDTDMVPPTLPNKPATVFWSWKRLMLSLVVMVLLAALGIMIFLMYQGVSFSRNIQVNNTRSSFLRDMQHFALSLIGTKRTPLRGEHSGRVNILLLGRAGAHYPGQNLTDTVMVMSIDMIEKKVALLSLPRDLYTLIPDTRLFTKINSLYQYGLGQNTGIEPVRLAVEEITGQPIHYFFILDFDGFEKVINALGGISIEVPRDFYDPRYPGKNYSYETFEIKKGWQTLDGATALKYVRERHNDPEGDFGRAKRQQQVIQAVKDKAFSLGTFFNIFAVSNVLDALGESIITDMTIDDMEGLLKLAKVLDTKNISSVVVDAWKKESLLRVSHVEVGPTAMFILVPRIGNWNEIHDLSDNIFRLETFKERRERIVQEQPTLTILYTPEDFAVAQKMRLLTEDMGFAHASLTPLTPPLSAPRIPITRPVQSTIVDTNILQKPFSLDELLKKFPLTKTDSIPLPTSADNTADFVITIGTDLATTLSFEEGLDALPTEDTAFPEVLPPQPLH